MMRKWWFILISTLLLTNPIACGKNGCFNKNVKANYKHENILLEKSIENRIKRSLKNENEKLFMPFHTKLYDFDEEEKGKEIKSDLEQPFWGTRGRRGSSEENISDMDKANSFSYDYTRNDCKTCYKSLYSNVDNLDSRDDTISPFWGNRGRRNSDDIEDNSVNDEPFWGNRGKRHENEPFWSNRGRRHEDEPFWGNRGKRGEISLKNEKILGDDTEPFWGNRGRRRETEANVIQHLMHEETEPFWGNRGRRVSMEAFWDNRGKRKYPTKNVESDPFWGNRGRRNSKLKDNIISAMKYIKGNVENLSRLRAKNNMATPFWSKRGRNSKLQNLFKIFGGSRLHRKSNPMEATTDFGLHSKPSESETMLVDRIYAEQPHYILVERSSRSSAEDDPFFISRGKKFIKKRFPESSRGRRGDIDELVKSVKTDPYYIARGKKGTRTIKIGNSTILGEEFEKAEELICSTIDLLTMKDNEHEVKRDINENERERRTILKKLAAQLQVDPYFVSRGKKSDLSGENWQNLEDFINEVAAMCD